MKKIFSILSAGILGLLAASCVQEELATFDISKATAPVLGTYVLDDDGLSVNYTPATFEMGFNEKMPVYHNLLLVSVDGSSVSNLLTSTAKDGVLKVSTETLSKALIALGHEEGEKLALELVIHASMQEPTKDNLRNGYVDSEGKIVIDSYEVFLPTGDPYARYTEKSAWGLTGTIGSAGISWDGDVEMWTNGTLHVAKAVTLAAGEEVKFRKDAAWDENFGYSEGVTSYVLGEEFSVAQGGANIAILEDGVYDLILDPAAGTAKIIKSVAGQVDPYASYTETSPWGLTGTISSEGISWDGDVEMMTNGTLHVAKSVTLAAGEEVKFRKDAGWDENFGYAEGVTSYVLGEDFSVAQGGANIAILEDGVYDLILDPVAGTAKIIKTIAVTIDPYASYTETSPWGLTGTISSEGISWDGDVEMVTNGTLHVAKAVALNASEEVKFRKDAGWDVNFGYVKGSGTQYVLGEEFEVAQDGDNIVILADGVYDLILDPENAKAKIIASVAVDQPDTPQPQPKPTSWSLSGTLDGSNWDKDFDLSNTSGDTWVIRSVTVTASDEFKIRANHDWAKSVGGPEENAQSIIDESNPYGVYTPELGKAFAAGSTNIRIAEAGVYDVTYDYAANTILIEKHVAAYSLIGKIDGDSWSKDVLMTESDGVWTSPVVTIDGDFKIRYDYSWDAANTYGVAEGVTPTVGEAFTAVQPGANITVPAGNYRVTFTPATLSVLITEVAYPEQLYMIGAEFGSWNWGSDDIVDMVPVYNQDGKSEGQFWTVRYFTAGQGFKFCSKKAWDGDFWGLTTNDGYTESGGNCVVAEDGIYLVHVDFKREMVHVEKARVYGAGNAFNGKWGEEDDALKFTASGKTLTATTLGAAAGDADGGLRMWVASTIATSEWWTREFVFFDGKIAYRGNGGDQARVSIEAGKKITLDFNAGTATVE